MPRHRGFFISHSKCFVLLGFLPHKWDTNTVAMRSKWATLLNTVKVSSFLSALWHPVSRYFFVSVVHMVCAMKWGLTSWFAAFGFMFCGGWGIKWLGVGVSGTRSLDNPYVFRLCLDVLRLKACIGASPSAGQSGGCQEGARRILPPSACLPPALPLRHASSQHCASVFLNS